MSTYQQHISFVELVSHAYVHISRALLGISTEISIHTRTYAADSKAYLAYLGVSTKISTHTPTYGTDSKAHVYISTSYLIRRVGISCMCAHIKSLVRYIYQYIYTYPHLHRRQQGTCARIKGISHQQCWYLMHMCTYQEPCQVYIPRYLHIPPPTPPIARYTCKYQGHI